MVSEVSMASMPASGTLYFHTITGGGGLGEEGGDGCNCGGFVVFVAQIGHGQSSSLAFAYLPSCINHAFSMMLTPL